MSPTSRWWRPLLWLSIAIYNKDFTDVVMVTLKADYTGNALQAASDVKERGLIVGSVKEVKVASGNACADPNRTCVSVSLALDPSKVKDIPRNVSARILPKTIFGEQFVSLSIPKNPGPAIKAGDVIAQDRSKGALEAQKVFGDLLPLLQAVQPAELNATLTAVAEALHGRGAELGQTLVQLDQYLTALNPHAKKMVDDLVKLGHVADEYNGVSPDLLQSFRNLETSARTTIAKRDAISQLFTTSTDTSNVIRSFLAENEQRMITVVGTSAKIYRTARHLFPGVPLPVRRAEQTRQPDEHDHPQPPVQPRNRRQREQPGWLQTWRGAHLRHRVRSELLRPARQPATAVARVLPDPAEVSLPQRRRGVDEGSVRAAQVAGDELLGDRPERCRVTE